MSFINVNWYIALAFCLFFFIGGRQLAEVPGGTPRARRSVALLLLAFAAPAVLFPLAYIPGGIAGAPWYNTFRSINRIELFSSMIAPATGYLTYRKPDLPYREYRYVAQSPLSRLVKPLALPVCLLFVSLNFIRPLVKPLGDEIVFNDIWADNGVLLQSTAASGGPAALISAMNSLNNYVDSEFDAVKGTYTDRAGTEFWYLARYATNRGYRTRFLRPDSIEDAPVHSIIPVMEAASDEGAYVTLLKRSESGVLIVGDPAAGRMELSPKEFISLYGDPELVLALSVPRNK